MCIRDSFYFAVTLLSPLFPVCVVIVFPHIAQAMAVSFVSLIFFLLTLWAWAGLWRSAHSRAMKVIGTVTGGVGAVLGLVLTVCAWVIFCAMS